MTQILALVVSLLSLPLSVLLLLAVLIIKLNKDNQDRHHVPQVIHHQDKADRKVAVVVNQAKVEAVEVKVEAREGTQVGAQEEAQEEVQEGAQVVVQVVAQEEAQVVEEV